MQVAPSQSARLSAFVVRNGEPWTGRSVSVRVVDAVGNELMTATPALETEPGLYSAPWNSPPLVGSLTALWTSGLRTWSEAIDVVAVTGSTNTSQAVVGVIPGDESTPLVGVMGREEQVDGVVGRTEGVVAALTPGDDSSGLVGAILADDGKTITAVLEEK